MANPLAAYLAMDRETAIETLLAGLDCVTVADEPNQPGFSQVRVKPTNDKEERRILQGYMVKAARVLSLTFRTVSRKDYEAEAAAVHKNIGDRMGSRETGLGRLVKPPRK